MPNQDKEYQQMTKKASPPSPKLKNMLCAFLVGGLICAGGEGLRTLYISFGLDAESAGTAVSISLVFLGALFTGLGLYDDIARFAGAGTLVPITGFANSVVAPALEFKREGIIPGTCAKMFTIAGPVIVFGTLASAIYGVILILLQSV